jgi:hypothetical protein
MTYPPPCPRCQGQGYLWTMPVETITPEMSAFLRKRCECDGGCAKREKITRGFPAELPPHPNMKAREDADGWSCTQVSGEIWRPNL